MAHNATDARLLVPKATHPKNRGRRVMDIEFFLREIPRGVFKVNAGGGAGPFLACSLRERGCVPLCTTDSTLLAPRVINGDQLPAPPKPTEGSNDNGRSTCLAPRGVRHWVVGHAGKSGRGGRFFNQRKTCFRLQSMQRLHQLCDAGVRVRRPHRPTNQCR